MVAKAEKLQWSVEEIMDMLREVEDPEIPVISVVDLGVIRDVRLSADWVEIDMTPTYSGCPAMRVMENDVRKRLSEAGIENIVVKMVLSPPWTTDWINPAAREKLRQYGIAPPAGKSSDQSHPFHDPDRAIDCPFCQSGETEKRSEFGSTPCKAMYYCNSCQQPFEHFKCI